MRLIAVGLGPGDPELVTVRAAKVLSSAKVVIVPYSSNSTRSLAEAIVRTYFKGEVKRVKLPMKREVDEAELDSIAEGLCRELEGVDEAVYVTLGDPSLYSTVYRFVSRMKCVDEMEVVPGVASFTACASKAKLSLAVGDEGIAIVPASRRDLIEKARGAFETVVILKGSMGLTEASQLLNGYRKLFAKRCYMEGERIGGEISDDDYFSMLIARWDDGKEG